MQKFIAKIVSNIEDVENDTNFYNIENKIQYNKLDTFVYLLNQYGTYGGQIDELYEEHDKLRPGVKKQIFKYFKTKYLLEKQKILSTTKNNDPLSVIRKESDNIMRSVFEVFKDDLKKSNNFKGDMEDIDSCLLAIICHAFINCKILEKPPNDNR
ncbi:MAG: hypothetical protein OXJ52_09805 [Oligoflexia bacterium]|nr:hypothetical protein [Oligoflexia bacterium]